MVNNCNKNILLPAPLYAQRDLFLEINKWKSEEQSMLWLIV